MTELKQLLEKSLTDDSCLSITINCHIPKLTLRINDSRQMVFYGIGLDRQPGFTLNVGIDKNSNKGKKIAQTLKAVDFLTDFKVFEDKRSVIYLKDFGQKIELITKTVQDLLDNFKNDSSEYPYQLTVNRTDANFRLE